MALWTGLGQAATVAQLVGADVGGLISMIMQAALTARQNRKECEQLARRVFMIAKLLPHLQDLQDLEAARQLAGLGDTLRDAHELVVSCQGKSAVYQLVMAGRQAERFREVQSKMDFYLILFPVISHIGITRRLDRIYNVLVQDDSVRVEPSQFSQSSQLQEVAQEVLARGTQEFTLAQIVSATNNFANELVSGSTGALWTGLGRAATVAQLVGADVGGLISMIMQAALTARQNRKECARLEKCHRRLHALLQWQASGGVAQLPCSETAGDPFGEALGNAAELVESYKNSTLWRRIWSGGRMATELRDMQERMATELRDMQDVVDSYCSLLLVVNAHLLLRQQTTHHPPSSDTSITVHEANDTPPSPSRPAVACKTEVCLEVD